MTKISHDSETLAEGQQVITVCAFIHQKIYGQEKVFLPKRAATKKFLPGAYELPGGHVYFGEDLVDALKREIDEEFGVEIEVGDPFFSFTYVNEIKKSHSVEIIYFARLIDSADKITINQEDHSEFGWYGEDELINTATSEKGIDDIEYKAMHKGFALLNGQSLEF